MDVLQGPKYNSDTVLNIFKVINQNIRTRPTDVVLNIFQIINQHIEAKRTDLVLVPIFAYF